jgi:cytolysin-activating lysine-acyltransferase
MTPGQGDSMSEIQPMTVAQFTGEIVWLMTQSPVHKQLFISDLEWFCMPAVLVQQFRLFYGPNAPAAVAFWAFVDEETEARLVAGGVRLRPDEWKNGDRPWLVDLVAPFGGEAEILEDLFHSIFKDQPFQYLRMKSDGGREVVIYTQAPLSISS